MTQPTQLPQTILDKIRSGDAILFLGAGASKESTCAGSIPIPDGDKLRDAICDRFLGGALKNKALSHVAELAKNEDSLFAVQYECRVNNVPLERF